MTMPQSWMISVTGTVWRALSLSARKSRRSEEHTSELQSRQYLVCRLLLEKNAPACVHAANRLNHAAAEPEVGVATLFFFNDTATTEIYTLSLHDALPISRGRRSRRRCRGSPAA